MVFAIMVTNVKNGISAEHVQRQVNLGKPTSLRRITTLHPTMEEMGRGFSKSWVSHLPYRSWGIRWATQDFIKAHIAIKKSGKYNYEGCRIPIPTAIRFNRIREALGSEISFKEERVLALLEFGMPIDCKPKFGVEKMQKNHFSSIGFKKDIDEYLSKNVQSQLC